MIVGDHLTCDGGTWGGVNVTLAFQWQRSVNRTTPWLDIPGATAAVYQVTADDLSWFIRCRVTASNFINTVVAYSNVLGPFRRVIVGGSLGCGSYEVFVVARGGGATITNIPFTSLEWERVLDDTSAARCRIDGLPDDCCEHLQDVRPWQHELVIFRDGTLVWVGPIVTVTAPPDAYEVEARDLTAWWDHRLVHDDHDYVTPTDVATIFDDVADDAMAPDNSPGLAVVATPTGITSVQTILAAQHRTAGEVIRQLSDIGVDWTAIARSILAGGSVIPTGTLGPFIDQHFLVPPTTAREGLSEVNALTVRGSGGGMAGDTIYATAVNAAEKTIDGLLESIVTVPTVTDYDSANAAATSRVAMLADMVTVHDATFSPDAPVTLDQLVPGAEAHLILSATCILASDVFRLQRVRVSVGADTESVTADFMPLGTL